MKRSYTLSEVAALLGLPPEQTRALAQQVLEGPRDLFAFQDVVLLRSARQLIDRKVSKRRIATALERLRSELPEGQALSGVALGAEGHELVVAAGTQKWNAESGQSLFDFRRAPGPTALAHLAPVASADQLFEQACQAEEANPGEAVERYLDAVAANPMHADAHVNVGRLLHGRGRLREAEAHYVAALVARPADATATFNLAVVYEDLGRLDDAVARYTEAIALDPSCVDAYFNLSRLYEKKGEKLAAIRHLKDYRRLSRAP